MISITELNKFNIHPQIKQLKTFEATVKSPRNRRRVIDAIKNNNEFVRYCLNNEGYYYINQILQNERLIDFIILVRTNIQ